MHPFFPGIVQRVPIRTIGAERNPGLVPSHICLTWHGLGGHDSCAVSHRQDFSVPAPTGRVSYFTNGSRRVPEHGGTRSRFADIADGVSPTIKTQNEWRGGLDAKVVLHDALTFDFTANPDFSQVESDEPQVTVNQRYEVFFPEKRPFFTEGAGFLQTPENLFFSRRIADPQFGLRMTGKVGPWALGLLASDDRAPGQLVPATDPMSGDRADIGIFRVQREVGKQSAVGFLFSRRHFGSSSNEVFSADTRLKLGENWVFTGQAVHSMAHELAGDRLSGSDYFAEIEHAGLHLNYFTSYLDRDLDFRADLGFIPRVDIRQLKNDATYQWRPEHGSLVSFGPTLNTRVIWDHRGQLQSGRWTLPSLSRSKARLQSPLDVLRSLRCFRTSASMKTPVMCISQRRD
jgi:hypothetical protein